MKALVARCPLGLFAFSEKGELIYYKLWDAKVALEKFLSKEFDSDFASNLSGYDVQEAHEAYIFLRRNIRDYAKNIANLTDVKFNEFLSSFSIAFSKNMLHGSMGRDRILVQAVRSLDDLTRAINVFSERLYEWYSLHYPEVRSFNPGIVEKHGRRENVPGFKSSVGADMTDEDESAVRLYARLIINMETQKKFMEKYIESAAKDVMPNFSSLINPVLASRLLAAAGSLEKLARMPASTIQLLGAEKALFRHLKQKGKSPKYGLIYNSNVIQSARENQGKIARILSSKLMLAARIDYYSGREDSEKLKRDLDDEIRRINK